MLLFPAAKLLPPTTFHKLSKVDVDPRLLLENVGISRSSALLDALSNVDNILSSDDLRSVCVCCVVEVVGVEVFLSALDNSSLDPDSPHSGMVLQLCSSSSSIIIAVLLFFFVLVEETPPRKDLSLLLLLELLLEKLRPPPLLFLPLPPPPPAAASADAADELHKDSLSSNMGASNASS